MNLDLNISQIPLTMSKAPHPSRIFKTPDELLKAWNDYKTWRDSSAKKWEKVQYVGKDGERVTDAPPMPYDIDGFYVWYHDNYGMFIHQYFENKDGYYADFVGIVTRIKAERDDNVKTGSLLGFFNASMGNRITGLADKQQREITAEPRIFDVGKD